MPTYDYRCNACGHAFELFQSMTARHEKKCPKCGKSALERLIGTGAAVLFKGSGFYQTDYRSEGYKKAADADKPAPAAEKPDTKPADAAKPTTETKSDAKTQTTKHTESPRPDSKPTKPSKVSAKPSKKSR